MKLYLMVGVPGSGKTFWIDQHKEDNSIRISRDEVRRSLIKDGEPYFSKEPEVYDKWIQRIVDNLQKGLIVYADATHINFRSRLKTLSSINKFIDIRQIEVNCIWLKTPLQTSLKQNEQREGFWYCPKETVLTMNKNFIKPEFFEGFNKIYIIEPNKPIEIKENNYNKEK